MEKIQKNDFVEIEFTGRSQGKIFDTTHPEEAHEVGFEKLDVKPLIISIGNDMLLKGLDEQLEGRELNKEYVIPLSPEKAFGKRNPQLLKTYSLNSFRKNKIDPYPGMTLQLDNSPAKVLSVTGGRVTVDFNNPLAGKDVEYTIKANKKIIDDKNKINALQDYFFRQRFEFEIEGKKVVFKDKVVKLFLDVLGEKFKQMTGLQFEAKVEDKKEQSTPKNK